MGDDARHTKWVVILLSKTRKLLFFFFFARIKETNVSIQYLAIKQLSVTLNILMKVKEGEQ